MPTHETPNKSSRHGMVPKMVVIHGDAGKTDAGTISWIKADESDVSYHYLVGRDGQVHQFVDENLKAWHAGKSEWPGVTHQESVNHQSIGVAFANDGTGSEPFTSAQYEQGAKLVGGIIRRHRIPIDMIRGHHEVSPGRKQDPWDWFDWERFVKDVALHSHGKAA